MAEKILLDPHRRGLESIFDPADLKKLRSLGEIIWGKDQPVTEVEWSPLREEISIIITGNWRYGEVSQFPNLRAILEVSKAILTINDGFNFNDSGRFIRFF